MKVSNTLALTSAALVLLAGCQSTPGSDEEGPRATASLVATKGNKTHGEVTFDQVGDKVRVVVQVIGLKRVERDPEHPGDRLLGDLGQDQQQHARAETTSVGANGVADGAGRRAQETATGLRQRAARVEA